MPSSPVAVYVGEALAAYGFGEGHPFGPDRLHAFWERVLECGLDKRVQLRQPQQASEEQILRFHTAAYLARVKQQSISGSGYLDAGDTPAFAGMFEAAATVAGTVLARCGRVLRVQRLRYRYRDLA
jgi:acetoin utilization protein AcuC